MSTEATAVYHDRLMALADQSRRHLLDAWDSLPGYDEAASLVWHQAASPYTQAVAQAAVDLTTAWADASGARVGDVPELIVTEAGAHAFDPFDRLAARLAAGETFSAAVQSARSVVEALGRDSAHGPARAATGFAWGDVGGWCRRLHAGACDWCMSFANIEWPTAEWATFGHGNCQCAVVPTGELGDINTQITGAAGFTDQQWTDKRRELEQRRQVARLEAQRENALGRSRQAGAERVTEQDPDRAERLSIREQEWETRAELYAERLRILTTGSHRIR